MNIVQLENFIGLVKYMNFTKAAEALHISQSTLSKQISLLEYDLKTELIVRNNRTISLTVAGEYLADQGEKLLKMMGNIEHNLLLISNEGEGPLILSATSDGSRKLYDAMNEFQDECPTADLIVKRDVMRDVVHAVLDGTADMGITTDYVFEDATKQFPSSVCGSLVLEEKPFYLVVPEDDPLAAGDTVRLSALSAGCRVAVTAGIQEYALSRDPNAAECLKSLKIIPPSGNTLVSWEDMVVQIRLHKYYVVSPAPNINNGCKRLRIEDEPFRSYNLILIWRYNNRNKFREPFLHAIENTYSSEAGNRPKK